MPETIANNQRPDLKLLLIGSLLFMAYYLSDCLLDSLIFGEGTFKHNLFSPSAHEMAIRSLSGIFLFALYLVSVTLINKNKTLQRDLLTKSHEIIQSNRELDTYNHTLSHQLRNSLTRILLSKERLKFDCFQCSSLRGKGLLAQLSDDCDSLSVQINEMLEYSEVSHLKLERKRIVIDDITREIAKGLTGKSEAQVLDFQIDKNLEMDCDPKLMHLALRNLINCSVHNNSSHLHNAIRIGMKKRDGEPIYFIRTSRSIEPGIMPQAEDRSDHPEPSRHLINIKTARSIIERHGGQLWARKVANDNPAFYFTL